MLTSTSYPRWYVIYCKPREDARALEHLERQGFTCFFPTLGVEKFRHGRKITVQEPLFPRYFFIHLDDVSDNWAPIRSTRGVLQLVRFNDYPLAVADQLIQDIQARLKTEQPRVPYLQPGDTVLIAEGPFAHLEAIFIANDGEARVMLLMNILQTEQALSFPLASVRKARDAAKHSGPVAFVSRSSE